MDVSTFTAVTSSLRRSDVAADVTAAVSLVSNFNAVALDNPAAADSTGRPRAATPTPSASSSALHLLAFPDASVSRLLRLLTVFPAVDGAGRVVTDAIVDAVRRYHPVASLSALPQHAVMTATMDALLGALKPDAGREPSARVFLWHGACFSFSFSGSRGRCKQLCTLVWMASFGLVALML